MNAKFLLCLTAGAALGAALYVHLPSRIEESTLSALKKETLALAPSNVSVAEGKVVSVQNDVATIPKTLEDFLTHADVVTWRSQSGFSLMEDAMYVFNPSAEMNANIRSDYAASTPDGIAAMASAGDPKAAFIHGFDPKLSYEARIKTFEDSLVKGNITQAAFQVAMQYENAQTEKKDVPALMIRLQSEQTPVLTEDDRHYLTWVATAAALNDIFSQNLLRRYLLPRLPSEARERLARDGQANLARLNALRAAERRPALQATSITPTVLAFVDYLYPPQTEEEKASSDPS